MKRIIHALVVAAALLPLALPAAAYDLGDSNLLVPIAGRTAGAMGTQWRTDLVVTNLEPEPVNLFVTFHTGPTSGSFTDLTLPGSGSVVLEDVVGSTFMTGSGFGMLRVNSAMPGARFTARAYIYNRGASGEFGQGVPALPVDMLGQQHVLPGLIGEAGRRTNVGIANPWSTEADVLLVLHSESGEPVGQHALTVAPETVVQLNDIFATLGVPPSRAASVHVYSSIGVYPYASVVRNETGDAVFIGGTGMARHADVLPAGCSEPAPLIHPWRGGAPAEETSVEFQPGTTRDYADYVAQRHGFTIADYFDAVPAITAVLTPAQIAAIRCDPVVKVIRRDGATTQP